MKIYSIDRKSWISITTWVDEHQYRGTTIEASVELGLSRFHGKNIDIHLLSTKEFLAELDRFILDRDVRPRLEGTYESFIEFYGDASHIFLNFRIGDLECGKHNQAFSLCAGFEIDQDQIQGILASFSEVWGET